MPSDDLRERAEAAGRNAYRAAIAPRDTTYDPFDAAQRAVAEAVDVCLSDFQAAEDERDAFRFTEWVKLRD